MRIVSLCPSLTELIFDLGRGDDLVGITRWCVHPRPAVDSVEKVGGTKNPDVDRILELEPDLVLLNREENRREDAEALDRAGVCCHVSMPRDAVETAAMVREIGVAVDRPGEADEISRRILERAAAAARRAAGRPPVPFAYLIWRRPWMAAGGDTYAHALLELAGGRNVFAHRAERYPEIEPAELTAAAPSLVLLSTEPFPFDKSHQTELAAATGLPAERFYIADGEYLSWHGSRTPAGIDYAVELLTRADG